MRGPALAVDLILGGEIHLPYVRSLRERFSDLPRRSGSCRRARLSRHVRDGIQFRQSDSVHASGAPAALCRPTMGPRGTYPALPLVDQVAIDLHRDGSEQESRP